MKKEIRKILKTLTQMEVRWIKRNNSHFHVYCPNGKLVLMSSTPSDHNAIRNIKQNLKEGAIDIDNARVTKRKFSK